MGADCVCAHIPYEVVTWVQPHLYPGLGVSTYYEHLDNLHSSAARLLRRPKNGANFNKSGMMRKMPSWPGQCHFSFCTQNGGVKFDGQCHYPNPAAFIEVNAVLSSLTKFCSKKRSYVDTILSSTYKRVLLIFHTTPTSKSYNRLAAVLLPSCCRAV